MTEGRLKAVVLQVYLVGAAGFVFPSTRPLFILLTPVCLLLTAGLLVFDASRRGAFRPRAVAFVAAVYLVSLLVEMAGVHTGRIFGAAYTYGRALGPKLADTPLLIGVNWVLLVAGSAALFARVRNRLAAAFAAAAAMVVFDLVMEQVCHTMDLWYWPSGRVPWQNYATWFALSLLFHLAAVALGIRFRSAPARWVFGVQFGFFLTLFLLFEHLDAVRAVFGALVFLGLAARLGVSLANLEFRAGLPAADPPGEARVSVLIPARNEEARIGALLESLRAQTLPPLEVLVYDDQSEDGTAGVVREHAQGAVGVRLLPGGGLPAGWLGKSHACHRLALEARGDYFLFLDADVRLGPEGLAAIVAHLQRHDLALLSLFPEQRMESVGEWLTVPLMFRVLLSLLPLRLVSAAPQPALSAANGQCLLFNAEAYRRHEPHRQVRAAAAEDIAVARFLKRGNERIACLLGNGRVYCRMYASYAEGLNGFARSVADFFGGSLAAAALFGLVGATWLFPAWFGFRAALLLPAVGLNAAVALLNGLTARQPPLKTLLLQWPQEAVFLHLVCRAVMQRITGEGQWKGRSFR